METLDAKGAEVCGIKEAVGLQADGVSLVSEGAALGALELLSASLLAACELRTRVVVVFRVTCS